MRLGGRQTHTGQVSLVLIRISHLRFTTNESMTPRQQISGHWPSSFAVCRCGDFRGNNLESSIIRTSCLCHLPHQAPRSQILSLEERHTSVHKTTAIEEGLKPMEAVLHIITITRMLMRVRIHGPPHPVVKSKRSSKVLGDYSGYSRAKVDISSDACSKLTRQNVPAWKKFLRTSGSSEPRCAIKKKMGRFIELKDTPMCSKQDQGALLRPKCRTRSSRL